jgi:serine/threonine protein kinase/tetratricopeptide (TPR) repeat protein
MTTTTGQVQINNRYRLYERIGQGGMGTVHRAVDRLTGEAVALKRVIVRTNEYDTHDVQSNASENSRLSLAREFEILASLRHPNVISVLDYGFDADQQPYYTMTLLENARTLTATSNATNTLGRVRLIIDILQALAYLHRRGVIHRDLKPGNVLIDKEGQVKVLDFGLAIRGTESGQAAGTLAYMAPEILNNESATILSDLFALGVMAYEMLTGMHPFEGKNTDELMRNILHSEPNLMRLPRIGNVSAPVKSKYADEKSEQTYDLLRIDPDHRTALYASPQNDDLTTGLVPIAADVPTQPIEAVEAAVVDLDNSDDDSEKTAFHPPQKDSEQHRQKPRSNSTHDPSNDPSWDMVFGLAGVVGRLLRKKPAERYQSAEQVIHALCEAVGLPIPEENTAIRESFLAAAAFVGRDKELDPLRDGLKHVQQRKPSAWLIGGESGIGKSRLVDELATLALVRGVDVLRGQGVADGGLIYQLWREPLRRLVLSIDVSELEAGVLKSIVPDIETLLDRDVPDVAPLSGAESKRRLIDTIVDCFRRVPKPLLLILEDVHWAAESFDVLKALLAAGSLPLMIVSTYRSDEQPDLPSTLPAARHMLLQRLDETAIASLSTSMLGGHDEKLVQLISRETEGNVFFIVEVMRTLAEEAGRLSAIGQTPLPERITAGGIEHIIETRLSRVSLSDVPMLKFAAVAGRQIDVKILDQVHADLYPGALERWLESGLNSAMLEVRDGAWRFAHDKLREGILARLNADERADLHRRVAHAIESLYLGNPTQFSNYAELLAEHWDRAGNAEKAIDYIRKAADRLIRIAANYANAESLIRRGLALVDSLPEEHEKRNTGRAWFYSLLGDAASMRSVFADAKTHYEAALATPDYDPDMFVPVMFGLCRISWQQGNHAVAMEYAEQALAAAKQLGNVRYIIQGYNSRGTTFWWLGKLENAESDFLEALRISLEANERFELSKIFTNLGLVARGQGQYPQALTYYEKALHYSRLMGDRRGSALLMNNIGVTARVQGDLGRALSYFAECLAVGREIGDKWMVSGSLFNHGNVAHIQQQYDKAKGYFLESLQIRREINDRSGLVGTLNALGSIAHAQHDFSQASAYFEEALSIARDMKATPFIAEVLTNTAILSLDLGMSADAHKALSEALSLAQQVNSAARKAHLVLAVAYWMLINGNPVRAAEFAGLIASKSEYVGDIRAMSNHIVSRLTTHVKENPVFTSDEYHAALERGKVLDLDTVLSESAAEIERMA